MMGNFNISFFFVNGSIQLHYYRENISAIFLHRITKIDKFNTQSKSNITLFKRNVMDVVKKSLPYKSKSNFSIKKLQLDL